MLCSLGKSFVCLLKLKLYVKFTKFFKLKYICIKSEAHYS